jgi:uncharacterized protein
LSSATHQYLGDESARGGSVKLLVHIATGPENPTRLALGLLVARTALGEGHEVAVFLAGDGVDAARPEARDLLPGVGTGSVAEHWQALREGGARLFASGLSGKARGVAAGGSDELQMAPPDVLVRFDRGVRQGGELLSAKLPRQGVAGGVRQWPPEPTTP